MQALAPVVAFLVAGGLLRVLLVPAARGWFLDHPNQRSLHASPIPRVGGLAIVPGVLFDPAQLRATDTDISAHGGWRAYTALDVRLED